jgi:hypothetical protein
VLDEESGKSWVSLLYIGEPEWISQERFKTARDYRITSHVHLSKTGHANKFRDITRTGSQSVDPCFC